MKIHEYQAKSILRKFNVKVPQGEPAFTPEEAVAVAKRLGGSRWVVKAQIHAGGRGKGGGVKIANSLDEVRSLAGRILGMRLVTHQTGPEGRIVHRLLIEEGISIARELYIGVTLDRAASQDVVMASSQGGVEIEQVAAEHPELILKEYVDPSIGFREYQARSLAFGLGLSGDAFKHGVRFLLSFYEAYQSSDASLAEINPLVVTTGGDVLALDAKVNLDDNALGRHPDFSELRDVNEEDPLELEASKHSLNYIKLDGNVGRSEEHTSELQSLAYLVCRLLLGKKTWNVSARYEFTTKTENYAELAQGYWCPFCGAALSPSINYVGAVICCEAGLSSFYGDGQFPGYTPFPYTTLFRS